MRRFLGEDQVRKVKAAIDLVQVMSDYGPVRRAGRQFTMCCPFHQERTPSCYLYPEQQTYHCFGCGAHGDVITLVREKEGLDFSDAVELLARRGNVALVWQERGAPGLERGKRDRLLQLNDFACSLYEERLWQDPAAAAARAYLARRHLGEEVCRRFRLGWAPGRGALVEAARKAGFEVPDLALLDMAVDRDGRFVDRFYERITFPICDRFGSVLAFSARLLPEAEKAAKEAGRGVGKYVNSTDTPLYHKSDVVFNLHRARSGCRDAGRLVVMEGPTDVMAAAQAGIEECVAVLGTALTVQHARSLGTTLGGKGELILLFDGDRAGVQNSLKAVRTCLAAAVPVRVAVVPNGLDPDELVQQRGREGLDAVLAGRVGEMAHLLRMVAPTPHILEPVARMAAVDQVCEILRPIPDADLRRACIDEAAGYFVLESARFERRLAELAGGAPMRPAAAASDSVSASAPPLESLEETLLHLLVRHPEARPVAFDELGVEPSLLQPPWRALMDALLLRPDVVQDELLLEPSLQDAGLREAIMRWHRTERGRDGQDLGNPLMLLREVAGRLLRRHAQDERQRLQRELVLAQRGGDQRRAAELFAAIRALPR
jgi:DNA primase